jgi:nicotinate-nucleotide--dimethylbenzimidazole phosphoribosyltransferase
MTDTGQVPGEGLPENAGEEAVLQPHAERPGNIGISGHPGNPEQQPTVPPWGSDPLAAQAPPAYAFLDQQPVVEEEEDLLIMPGVQGSWSDPQPVPPPAPLGVPSPVPASAPIADLAVDPGPDPAVDPALAEAHETGGRDSGPVEFDYSTVRAPQPVTSAPAAPVVPEPVAPPRRPLHMGPPMPDPATGGVVRSLADRGPTPAAQPPAPAPAAALVQPAPVRQPGPPTTGPEYFDVPQAETVAPIPAQHPGEAPPGPAAPEPLDAGFPGLFAPAAAWPSPAVAEEQPAGIPAPAAETSPPQPAPPVEPTALVGAAEPGIPAQAVHAELFQPVEPVSEPVAPELPVAEPEPVAAVPVPDADPDPVAPEALAPEQPPVAPVAEASVEPTPLPVVAGHDTTLPFGLHAVADDVAEAPEAVAVVEEPVVEEPAPEGLVTVEPLAAAPEPEVTVSPDPAEPVSAPASPDGLVSDEVTQASETEAALEPADGGRPAAEGYDSAVRDAVHRVIRERRDIRNGFRDDPIPHEVLIRVLEAAHTAPSVGHSQPWDFVVIRSDKTREKMHELATRQRDAYAKSLPKGRAKQFRELKIEAILDTPVNIVVTADPTRGGRHTLGRYTQPQMAPYSSALAVENLWLAARAEGLGVGWVSFFDEREMVRELGLPEHLEVVAYLCVGYVDEFPEEPELMQAGWSQRRPLAWVVHEEEYGNRALPGEEPHDLLEETLRGIRPLDAKALGEAWERQKRMTKPAGALGMLEIISAQLSGLSRQCPPPIPEPAAVAIFAGDHGVHAQGVTAWPQEVTAQMVANFLAGGAVVNAFANQVGAEVCVIDVGVASELPSTPGLLPRKVRYGTADFTAGPAMSREEVLRAIEVGIETARDLIAAGNRALLTGEMGVANTTTSAALISVYTGVDPAEVTGRGTGINDEMHARKVDVVRRALELHRPDPADPIEVLAAIGGLEHAAMVGLLLGAASLRTPVILDGVSAGAAALVARAIAPEVLAACIAGHRSAEPGHRAALTKLGLRPLVDLDLRLGEGTGALLALPLVQSAARAMHEVATFDSAGVTEKG